MEEIKLNQKRLNKICYILGSYDYEEIGLVTFGIHVYITLGRGDNYIAKFIMDEISEFMGEYFGAACLGNNLCLMFVRESPDEVLTIPEGLRADNE